MQRDVRYRVQEIADYLRLCIQAEQRTLKSIEEELGMGEGYLGQLLRGAVDLKLKHILGILDVLGLDTAEFFAAATGSSPGRLPYRLPRPLPRREARAQPDPPDETGFDDEMHERLVSLLVRSLRRVTADLAEQPAARSHDRPARQEKTPKLRRTR